MSDGTAGALARIDAWFADLRASPGRCRAALAVAVVAGLALATVHWLGLFAAGALVGLTRRNLARALLSGLAFGVLVLALFFLLSAVISPGPFISLTPLSYLTVGLALAGPTWGALLRGAV